MEIAELILEYVKALAWPLIIVVLALLFKTRIDNILQVFGTRMGTAENLKLGIMGQELNLSGTAKELLKQRDELLENPSNSVSALSEANRIEKSAQKLSDPTADLVGLALLRNASNRLSLEELALEVLSSMGVDTGETRPETLPKVAYMFSRNLEKILAELADLDFVTSTESEEYELTNKGRDFFQRVLEKQERFFKRFADVESHLRTPRHEPPV